MHVKAKKIAFGGLLMAMTVICMMLGSVIESNTLFLLAAASFFVGIMQREFGLAAGGVFYMGSVLLGILLAPNKLYVVSYAAMGFYILAIEFAWKRLAKMDIRRDRKKVFWLVKYLVFNLIYLPGVLGFQELLFAGKISDVLLAAVILAGQAGLFLYDRAYEYVQGHIWNRMRRNILGDHY